MTAARGGEEGHDSMEQDMAQGETHPREALSGLAAPVAEMLSRRRASLRVPGLEDNDGTREEKEAREKDGAAQDAPPALRSTFAPDDLARLVRRMARALSRLGLRAGETIVLAGQDTPHGLCLLLAACGLGLRCVVLRERAQELPPEETRLLVCPPAWKDHWRQLLDETAPAARLATLGGHFEGSFFMLQMAQPERPLSTASPTTIAPLRVGDETVAFETLLGHARDIATRHALNERGMIVFSLPLATPAALAHALAALLATAPLFWLPPATREHQLRHWAPPDTASVAIIADEALFTLLGQQRHWARALRQAIRLPASQRKETPS